MVLEKSHSDYQSLTPSIFSCEYLRKIIIVNELHFASKKKEHFNYPYSMQPLITKNKNVVDGIEKEIVLFGLIHNDYFHYEPLRKKFGLRKHARLSTYDHESREKVEMLATTLSAPSGHMKGVMQMSIE